MKLDPGDYDLLGLKLSDYFLDTCLPFGYRQGSSIFQCLSDAVRFIMLQKGHDITTYINDIFGHALRSQSHQAFDTLYNLLQELDFIISKAKLVSLNTKVTCLGIQIETVNSTLSIPPDKLLEIKQTCQEWIGRKTCRKRELKSLLGSLLYVAKCVRVARAFLNRILDTLDTRSEIYLDINFHRDLNWFLNFIDTINGTTLFHHVKCHFELELDACLQGLDTRLENQVYAITIPLKFQQYSIVHLEMLNILVAICGQVNQS